MDLLTLKNEIEILTKKSPRDFTLSVKEAYDKFYLNTHLDYENFQRKHLWTPKQDQVYVEDQITMKANRYIRLIDVESCLKLAIESDNEEDIEYFSELINIEKYFINIDGGHRQRNQMKVMSGDLETTNNELFSNSTVVIEVNYDLTKDEIHRMMPKMNTNVKWTRSSFLNNINSLFNNAIKEILLDKSLLKSFRSIFEKYSDQVHRKNHLKVFFELFYLQENNKLPTKEQLDNFVADNRFNNETHINNFISNFTYLTNELLPLVNETIGDNLKSDRYKNWFYRNLFYIQLNKKDISIVNSYINYLTTNPDIKQWLSRGNANMIDIQKVLEY